MLLLQAESALVLVRERAKSKTITPPLEPFDVPDANLIIRSSDHVDFRVHKPALALSSPFFKDLLSLPQPYDGETVDGLPMVQFSEDSELLNSLFSMPYPLRPVIPNSYDKVWCLL
jgi:BTB/POZ domain